MKNFTTLLFSVLFVIQANAQTSLYTAPNFEAIAADHKLIAVVPFDATVTLRPKEMKDISPEQLDRMEKAEGESIQNAMYAWFLKRQKNGKLTVKVQDPKTTNAKLAQAGVTYENKEKYTAEDIAKILEVDALISGTFETNKPMSEGASAALGVLVGFYGATNQATVNLFIHNAADGEVIVNYNKRVSGSMGSSADQLINVLMRKASRRIPYTK